MADTRDSGARELNIADVRWLIDQATEAGADAARVQAIAEQLVDALLDLQSFRAGDHDPRRQKSIELAQRVLRAKSGGADMETLRARFGRSKAAINKLLRLATSRATSARQFLPLNISAGDSDARSR
jgi:hypothetical protein